MICPTCKKDKDVSEMKFNKRTLHHKCNGYPICKECHAASQRKYRQSEKGRATKARYRNTKPERELRAEYYRKWAKENPHKRSAQVQAQRAHGESPDLCEMCKINKPILRHHPDYDKPLEIVWLCGGCHYQVHRNISKIAI